MNCKNHETKLLTIISDDGHCCIVCEICMNEKKEEHEY